MRAVSGDLSGLVRVERGNYPGEVVALHCVPSWIVLGREKRKKKPPFRWRGARGKRIVGGSRRVTYSGMRRSWAHASAGGPRFEFGGNVTTIIIGFAQHRQGRGAVAAFATGGKTEGVSTRVRPDKNSEGKIRRDGYFFGDKSLIFIFFVPEELN